MTEPRLAGNVLTEEGWRRGELDIRNGRIVAVPGELADPAANEDLLIVPGFIDLHVHGGGGADVMDGGDAFGTIARTHARHGTTSLLVTTMTAPREEIDAVLVDANRFMAAA